MFAAVIVTFNRKELLVHNINMLLRQSCKFDTIYIVDNCSTDGTYDLLQSKGWLNFPFYYLRTAQNMGGAGGFFTGVKKAYEDGADWLVLMDDDGYAANKDTFKILFEKAQYFYNTGKGCKKVFVNALVQEGDFLSFKIGNIYTVKDAIAVSQNGILEGEANPFNGTLISRELITEIGYPNKDFFIKGDEVDYKQRALDAGAYIVTIVNSRYIHPRPETHERKVFGIKVPVFVETPWKEYYTARNFTYMYKSKGWYKAIAFELIFVKLLAIFSMKCKKVTTIRMLFKGVGDGWKGKLGATVRP